MLASRIGIRSSYNHFRLVHSSYAVRSLFKKSAPVSPPPTTGATTPAGSPGAPGPTGAGQNVATTQNTSAAAKIASKIPRWLRPYTSDFANAPFSHVTAFLILHELTAIVPLIGLWYLFHQNHGYIPVDLPSWAIEKGMAVIDKGLAQFDFSDYSLSEKSKFLMEGAYAYAITKALFPARIIFSTALMPWFAKWFVIPFTKLFKRSQKKTDPKATAPISSVNDTKKLEAAKKKTVDKPRL